jgi:hypothetical protein
MDTYHEQNLSLKKKKPAMLKFPLKTTLNGLLALNMKIPIAPHDFTTFLLTCSCSEQNFKGQIISTDRIL